MKHYLYRMLSCVLLIAAAVVNADASIHYDTPMKYKLCMGDTIFIDEVRVVNDTIWYDTIVSSTPPNANDTLIRTTVVNKFPTFLKVETERRIERGGEPFTWHGIEISKAGMYEKIYKSVHECDSIYQVRVRERVETHVTDTLCLGSTKTFGNQTLTKPGIYRDSLHYADYDSITILSLIGHMPDTILSDIRIPEGTQFEWQGEVYETQGIYDKVFTGRFGCDSLQRLVLTVYHVDTIDTTVVVCPGESFTWHGHTGGETHVYEFPGVRENGDQVWYRLDLTVKQMVRVDTTFVICDDETVYFNNKTYANAGEYDDQYTCDTLYKVTVIKHPTKLHVQTGMLDRTNPYYWRYELDGVQYVDTILVAGTYEHRTHDPETGCNEIYRLILTKDETSYHYVLDTTICENDYYEWRGKKGLNRQGIGTTTHYFDRYRTISDQDSIYELILRVQPVPRTSTTIKFCGSIEWNNQTITETTIFVDTLTSIQYHCDSIVTTILSKGIPFHKHDTASIRPGETLEWRGQLITTDGLYKDSYKTAAGCDSIYSIGVGLEEVPVATPTRTWYESICEGDFYPWEADKQKYFNSGTYVDTVWKNGDRAQGLDSLHILHLTVNKKYEKLERITSHSFPTTYRGHEFANPGESYTFNYTSAGGCDSLITVVAEFEISQFEETVVICPGETYVWDWDDQTYRESGRYHKTITDVNGKDSVEHILNLTVRSIPDTYIKKTICKGSSITFGDQTLSESGNYTYTYHVEGCDSVVHLALNVVNPDTIRYVKSMNPGEKYTWHGVTYQETGIHYFYGTNRLGCDSIEILQLTINHVDTIDTVAVICPNEVPFKWHSITASQSGLFTGTEERAGVTSYYRLQLQVKEMQYKDTTFTICNDQTVTYMGTTYNESGTFANQIACDTIVNVQILKHPQVVYESRGTVTDDHGFYWTYWKDGVKHEHELFNNAGTYEYTSENPETGCNDIYRLILTKDENEYHFKEELTICEGDDFEWHGLGNLSSIVGTNTYHVDYKTHAGKDSTFELTLTVMPVERTVRTITFCGETSWKGKSYTNSAVVYDTISMPTGCYRIERINLDKAQSYYFTESKEWPQGKVLIWHGQNITTDGVYYDRQTTVQGCDSIYELTVTIIPAAPESNQYAEELSACEGDTIHWRGKDIWRSGTYVDTVWADGKLKVDSIFTLSFTAWPAPKDTIYEHLYTCNDGGVIRYNGKDYMQNDTVVTKYHTIHGCDSIVKTYLHFNEALFLRDTARVAENTLPYAWTPTGTDTTIYLMEPKTYQFKRKTNGGCENVWELFFEVYPVFIYRDSVAVCEGDLPYYWEKGPIEHRADPLSAEANTTREVSYSYKRVGTGADSVYILKLTILPQIKKIEQHYFCEGEEVSIYGKSYHLSGSDAVVRDTIMRPNPEVAGCDSIIYLEIYQNPVNRVTKTVIMHIGDTIFWEGDTITELISKTYTNTDETDPVTGCSIIKQLRVVAEQRTTATGCESMLPYTDWRYPIQTAGLHTDTTRENGFITGFYTLDLRIDTVPTRTIREYVCAGTPRTINNKVYGADPAQNGQMFRDTILDWPSSTSVCDSTIYYEIYVSGPTEQTETKVIREGEMIEWEGDTITEVATKTYKHITYDPVTNCEITHYLNVIAEDRLVINDFCALDTPYVWSYNNKKYYTTGVYTDTTYENGFITRFYTLDLTVKNPEEKTIFLKGCIEKGGVTFLDKVYLNDTIVSDTLNCDTVYTIHVNIHRAETVYLNDTICENDLPYILGRQNPDTIWTEDANPYYHSDTTAYGCDSTVVLTLHITPTLGKNDSTFICEDEIAEHPVVLGNLTNPWFDTKEGGKYHGKWEGKWTGVKYTTDTIVWDCNHEYFHHIIVRPRQKTIPEVEYSICKGDSVQPFWPHNPIWVKTDTVIYDTIPNINPFEDIKHGGTVHNDRAYVCDSITKWTFHLTDTVHEHLYKHIREGETYVFNDSILATTGVYDSIGNYTTMDSAHNYCKAYYHLHLTVHPVYRMIDTLELCERAYKEVAYEMTTADDSTYTFKFTTPEKDTAILVLKDSLMHPSYQHYDHYYTLVVFYRQEYFTQLYDTICEGDSLRFDIHHRNNTLEQRFLKVKGIYYDTIPALNGCDSIIQLYFETRDSIPTTYLEKTVSDRELPYIWTNSWYEENVRQDSTMELRETGIYQITMPNLHGCDSTIVMHFTVHQTHVFRDTITVCAPVNRTLSHIWDFEPNYEQFFTVPDHDVDTTYEDTLVTRIINDSIYHLYVHYHVEDSTIINATICEGDSMRFGLSRLNMPRFLKTPGTYRDTLVRHDNSCDSIIVLRLNVYPRYFNDSTKHIADVDTPYVWIHKQGGQEIARDSLYTPGNYEYIYKSQFGCDSIDSLHLFIHKTYHIHDDTINICYSETPFTWRELNNITETGNYENRRQTTEGYDSIYYVHINVWKQIYDTIQASICEGDSMRWGLTKTNKPRFVYNAGLYNDTLVSSRGCDSILVLNLNIFPRYFNDSTKHIADVDTPYVWIHRQGGQEIARDSLYAAGRYGYRYESSFGCDSIDSLTLVIHPTYLFKDTVTICYDQTPYTWYNADQTQIFQEGIYETGTYIKRLQTHDLYDSTYVRYVRVIPVIHDTIRHAMCEGTDYLFNGVRYSEGGSYTDTLVSYYGCDSIVTLILTVNKPVYVRIPADIYEGESYLFYGQPYTTSGTYRHYSLTPEGCDSIAELFLTVHPQIDTTVTICKSELPYTWVHKWSGQERLLYSPGIYRDDTTVVNDQRTFYTLQLVVNEPLYDTIRASICQEENDFYEFHGQRLTTTGIYRDTITASNGCDSITTLYLTVNKPYYNYIERHIVEGQSVEVLGKTYSNDTLATFKGLTPAGCDSITDIRIIMHPLVDTTVIVCSNDLPYRWINKWNGQETLLYAAGLYRNDTTMVNGKPMYYGLQLIINDPIHDTIRHAMCEGASYEFKGNTYYKAGIYRDTLTATNGCDSIVTLILTVNKPYYNIIRETILEGNSVKFYGDTYNTSGTYTHYARTPQGCDSTTILELTVHQLVDTVVTICSTELPYVWKNKWSGLTETLYKEGTYRNDTSMNGERYFYGLKLVVNHPTYDTIRHTMCEGDFYIFKGQPVYEAGIYRDTLTAANGCDSIVSYLITVNKPYYNYRIEHVLEGDSVQFFNEWYKETGTYTHYGQKIGGCDSTTVLQLVVHQLVDTVVTVCSTDLPYTWVNKWTGSTTLLYSAGTYRDDTTFVNGERMFYGLQLNIRQPSDTTIYREICEGSSYSFNGRDLTVGGEYRDTLINAIGCDSVIILNLNVLKTYHNVVYHSIFEGDSVEFQGKYYKTAGNYPFFFTSSYGCDSIIELQLTVNRLFDDSVSICANDLPYVWNGKTIYESGIYRDTVVNTEGKQTPIGLKVTVLPIAHAPEAIVVTICEGDSYKFGNSMLSAQGTYYDTLVAVNGCDSIVMLALQVMPSKHLVDNKTIFEGDTVMFYGDTLRTSGIYTHNDTTEYGCANTHQLVLTVLKEARMDTTAYVCGNELPFIWHGYEFNETGDYEVPTSWTDSSRVVTTLHLFVREAPYKELNISLCYGNMLIVNKDTIKKSGTYDYIVPTPLGCDSTIRYIVSVHNRFERWDTAHISDQQSYDFPDDNGSMRHLTIPGDYEYTGKTYETACDSIIHLHLVVHPSYYFKDSIDICKSDSNYPYVWKDGKDSIIATIYETGTYFNKHLTARYGFDSIYELKVSVYDSYLIEEKYELGVNEHLLIHEMDISKPGIYFDSLYSSHGCDSIYRIVVNPKRVKEYTWTKTICQGDYIELPDGSKKTITGNYTYYSEDRETIIHLSLTVVPVNYTEKRIVIAESALIQYPCESGTCNSYLYEGTLYKNLNLGNNIFEERTASGTMCDNIKRLIICVTKHVSEWTPMALCPGSPIKIDDKVITVSGLYTFERRSKMTGEIDSLWRVEVYDAPAYEFDETHVICDGDTLRYGNKIVTRGGKQDVVLKTVEGCDSIYHLNITVNPSYHIDTFATIFDYQSFTWSENHKTYKTEGIYEKSYPTINDCDSTYQLHLTVIPTIRQNTIDTICIGQEYIWRGDTIREAGYYTDTVAEKEALRSAIYTLNLTVLRPTNITYADVGEVCADGESFDIHFTYSGAKPSAYSVYFNQLAKNEGFRDIINEPFKGEERVAHVTMPVKTEVVYQGHTNYVRPNRYSLRLVLDNGVCGVSRSDSLTLLVKYPNWIIEQNWNDIVAPLRKELNGGYEFTQTNWYINGTLQPNNGLGYLHSSKLRIGDEVVMEATRKGESFAIKTCPLVITEAKPDALPNPIIVYPTQAPRHMPVITIEAPRGGQYAIYSSTGSLLSEGKMEEGTTQVKLPSVCGIYFIHTSQGKDTETHKVLLY